MDLTAEWKEFVEENRHATADEIPGDVKPIEWFSEQLGTKERATREWIARMEKDGKLERIRLRRPARDGKMRYSDFFRMVK